MGNSCGCVSKGEMEAKAAAEQRRRTLGLQEGTATDAECKAAEVRRPLLLAI